MILLVQFIVEQAFYFYLRCKNMRQSYRAVLLIETEIIMIREYVRNHPKKDIFFNVRDIIMMAFGAVVAAFAVEEFLVPNLILDGGVVGIGIMINYFTKIPLGVITAVLNIPFLIAGSKRIGKKFIFEAGFSMLVFSLAVEIFAPLSNATDDTLLAVCFGGVILGLGVGLTIKFGGCLDGTETIGILLNKKFGIPVGTVVLIFNVIIYGAAAILFGVDRGMYSLLTYFIASRILNMVENGIDEAKAAMIITNDAEEIARKIYKKLGRTVTIMKGEGLVSGEKVVLYCVLTRFEVYELKQIIKQIDQSAFVTISDVSEIIGVHMKQSNLLDMPVEAQEKDV